MSQYHAIRTVFKREFASYFSTPLALVFIIIFLVLNGIFTFYLGDFYERGQADLVSFFNFHPWLYLFLVPAISMRLWAEERKEGSLELLMTLPIRLWDAVLGKFLAAWAILAIALALTFPIWLTVNYLGEPDNGVILASYIGSFLMSGAFIAIGSCLSAATKNQVIAFIGAISVCFVFVMSGFALILDFFRGFAPQVIIDTVANMSFLTHFDGMAKGIFDVRDVLYFVALILVWLLATAITLDMKKAS